MPSFFHASDHLLRCLSATALLLGSLVATGCDEKKPRPTGGGAVGSAGPRDPKSIEQPDKAAPPDPAGSPKDNAADTSLAKNNSDKTTKALEPEKYAEITQRWGLGELHDLGPAGPATAASPGIYFVTRDDRLVLAARKGKEGFSPIKEDSQQFAKYGRGPAISKTHAYWISERQQLLRAPLQGGEPEVVYDKGRIGTRTSVVSTAGRDVVAFIAEIDEKPLAYVWASKGTAKPELLRLTPEGSTATSVALVEGAPHPRAVVLAGRLGMSPVHVRRVRTTPRRIILEPDAVIWIGPGSHVLTEIHAITRSGDQTVAFLPTAKDFNDFGLAQLDIGPEPGEIDEPSWYIYPNGLDPAPVATGNFCNKTYVLFARPTEARPRSPQELHLAEVGDGAPQEGDVVARSRAFNDLSVVPTKTGAVVSWTADRRTWGMVLTCPSQHAARSKQPAARSPQ